MKRKRRNRTYYVHAQDDVVGMVCTDMSGRQSHIDARHLFVHATRSESSCYMAPSLCEGQPTGPLGPPHFVATTSTLSLGAVALYLLAGAGISSFWTRSSAPVVAELAATPTPVPEVSSADLRAEFARHLLCEPCSCPLPEAALEAASEPPYWWHWVLAAFAAGLLLGVAGTATACCCLAASAFAVRPIFHPRCPANGGQPHALPGHHYSW